MQAYQTDHDGVFVGVVVCDESPMEPGVYLIPAGAVTVPPPATSDGEMAVWNGSGWNVQPIVIEPEPEIPPRPVYDTWDMIRGRRDGLLENCDWTQLPDAPVDAAVWAAYRQALRDVPQNFASPLDVVWPEKP